MATKAFHIELRVTNIDTDDRMVAIRKALQEAGRTLHAKSLLICGSEPMPEILLYGEDFVEGRTDIATKSDDEG